MKLDRSLLNDSLWSLIGSAVGRSLALFAGIVVARCLGKDVFGEYGIIKNTVINIGLFSTFGLGYTSTKIIADNAKKGGNVLVAAVRCIFFIAIIIGALIFFAVMLSADYIANEIFNAPHLTMAIRASSVMIVLNSFVTIQIGILSGLGLFKYLARVNMIVGIITFSLSSLLTYYTGIFGAFCALFITYLANACLNLTVLIRELPVSIIPKVGDNQVARDILSFSLPVALQEGVYSISTWLLSLMLVNYATYGELGLYTAAMQLHSIVLFIPGIMRNVILSHLSKSSNNKNGHKTILTQTIIINVSAVVIIGGLVLFFSENIISSYGNSFKGLDSLLLLACGMTLIVSVSNVYSQAYMSMGMNWIMLWMRVVRDLGKLGIAYILLNEFVFYAGGAMSVMFSSFLINLFFLIMMIFVWTKRDLKYDED